MINVYTNNRNVVLTAKTVEEIIRKEDATRVTTSYTNYGSSNINYNKYNHLFAYASRPYNQYQVNKGLQIFFYEWSDLTQPPRMFYTVESFNQFIKESNIIISAECKNRLELASYGLFCACLKDSNAIEMQYTFCALVGAWGTKSYAPAQTVNRTIAGQQTTMEEILKRDKIDVDFYECSNLESKPIHYDSWKSLTQFMKKYGIKMSSHNEKKLKALSCKRKHYASCVITQNLIVVRDTMEKLDTAIHAMVGGYDKT